MECEVGKTGRGSGSGGRGGGRGQRRRRGGGGGGAGGEGVVRDDEEKKGGEKTNLGDVEEEAAALLIDAEMDELADAELLELELLVGAALEAAGGEVGVTRPEEGKTLASRWNTCSSANPTFCVLGET